MAQEGNMTTPARPIPDGDPTTQEWQARMMQSAGPSTKSTKPCFFDIQAMPWRAVVTGLESPEAAADPMTSLKALVNPGDGTGCSLQAVKYRPNAVVPRHSHSVPQIVFIVEGEARQGNRVFGPGSGYYTPAGSVYSVQAGDEGVTLIEFRPTPLDFSSDYVGETTPHLRPSGAAE
jgi:quercetin dioxygenase-like cupin family protein